MGIRISAVVCTRNRANYLRKNLCSLAGQTLSKDQYEIVIVDNGSTDETKKVACEEFADFENLRYFYEPVLGLSQARNTGWRNANGSYVAFLDDDATACSTWLEKIVDIFETMKPTPGCIGGKIELIWEAPRPQWLCNDIVSYLGMLDLSRNPVMLDERQYLFGGNMAFPKSVLKVIGGFNSTFGRSGTKLLSNEEVLLQEQIRKRGHRCFYHPGISVAHHTPVSRLVKSWFLKRLYWQGVSDAWMQMHRESLAASERLRLGFDIAKSVLFSRRQLFHLIAPTNDPDRFALKCSVIAKIGYLSGLWGVAR